MAHGHGGKCPVGSEPMTRTEKVIQAIVITIIVTSPIWLIALLCALPD